MEGQVVDYGFDQALDEWVGRLRYNAIRAIRKMARYLVIRAATHTPVDSGMARASWNLSLGKPNLRLRKPPKGGWSHAEALAKVREGAKAIDSFDDPLGQVIYIANGTPYLDILEHGGTDRWGHKQPAHKMLALARLETEAKFNQGEFWEES